ncbi:MAG: flagellar biosynthesis protein FlhB [Xanthobacteraceae bacterium]
MADESNADQERSEDPTQKRLEDAIKRGDVAKSQEVNTWFSLASGTLALFVFGGIAASQLAHTFAELFATSHAIGMDGRAIVRLSGNLLLDALIAIGPLLLLLMVAAIGGNLLQHRWLWTGESLKPKLSRISPAAGAKRLFSKHALVNFAKGLAKLGIVGAVIVGVIAPEIGTITQLIGGDHTMILTVARMLALRLLVGVVAVMAVVAALDWLWSRHTWYERQRMSLREIRDEYKESEGDPTIKAKLRQIRQARMRKRMMSEVPKATVVITNPTHYAIALKYEKGMNAPLCVAKGMDALALRIRELAEEHRVPVVENPPLARALHKSVELDQEVPPEHYKAVAEVIGFVMRLRRGVRH